MIWQRKLLFVYMHFSEVYLSLTFSKAYFISHLLTFKKKLHSLVRFFHSSWTLLILSVLFDVVPLKPFPPVVFILLGILVTGCLATAILRSPSLIHRQVPGFLRPADLQRELS